MLRTANSGFYSLKYKVTSIEKALTVLGVNIFKNIALSFVIAEEMRNADNRGFDFDYFWQRSVTATVAAELLASQMGLRSDEIFAAALLSDIGILILHQTLPEAYSRILEEKKLTSEPISLIERRHIGIDHGILGAILLENWSLPTEIFQPIRYHHMPSEGPEVYRKTAELLQIADRLSAIYHDPHSSKRVRQLQTELTERFNLTDEQFLEMVDNIANHSIEILASFEIDPGDLKPYSLMLQEANEELGRLNLSYEQLIMELKESKEEAERLATEIREANSKLQELVFRDGLTGLYNHRYFQEMLENEIDRAERYQKSFALIMFDIDFFKKINDSYGHPNGDLILMNIARVVQQAVRPSDIVARYGGEEFAVILPETNESGLRIFAERLRRSVEQMATLLNHQEVRVTISVGGAGSSAPTTRIDKKTILDAADRALYSSKHNGRNCVTILPLPQT